MRHGWRCCSPLPLLLTLSAVARGFHLGVPLSATARIRTGTFGSTTGVRTLSGRPVAAATRRGGGPTMDAGEEFDQLDGVRARRGRVWAGGGVETGLVVRCRPVCLTGRVRSCAFFYFQNSNHTPVDVLVYFPRLFVWHANLPSEFYNDV